MRIFTFLLAAIAVLFASSSAKAFSLGGPLGRLQLNAPFAETQRPSPLALLPQMRERETTSPLPQGSLVPELYERLASDKLRLAQSLGRNAPSSEHAGLDDGGGAGASGQTKVLLSMILGFFPGFGLGHLLAGDEDTFLFFLLIDAVVLGGFVVLDLLFGAHGYVELMMALGWVGIHVLQAIDAYKAAGGGRRFGAALPQERLPEQEVVVSLGVGRGEPLPAGNLLVFAF